MAGLDGGARSRQVTGMRIFSHFQNLPDDVRGAAVAIGNFDGVHLGHREVIAEAGRIARSGGRPWAVLTLEPHPRSIFTPDAPPFRLTPLPVKARLIEEMGVDLLIVVPFDLEFAKLAPRAFVEKVIVGGLGARHVVCGHDFAFGHGRRGTPEMLLWMGDEFDFGFTCVQEVRNGGGEPYSSTGVRQYLQGANPRAAAQLLGRPFEIEGIVVGGERRGRQLGFPTANVGLGDYLRPTFGIYAVETGWPAADDGDAGSIRWRPGVANLGVRPTFGADEPLLEVHIFDFDGDLYGRTLTTRLLHYLRPEKKFDAVEPLQAQMGDDCARARALLTPVDPALRRAAL
ncbi:MAG: bifunctional riboflavin kinase/FAD synthetase [Rhodospirillales bacterium]